MFAYFFFRWIGYNLEMIWFLDCFCFLDLFGTLKMLFFLFYVGDVKGINLGMLDGMLFFN